MSMGFCTPIVLVDLAGSVCLIVISALCLKEARAIAAKEPDNFLYGYLHWLFAALFAFSLSRSLGHIVKYLLIGFGFDGYWAILSPISGSINSALFLLIASITVFFQKMKKVMERIEQDKMEIERISQELLRLNKETELLVSQRTRAELALSIAHNIRNPIMVIGGIARRLLKRKDLPEELRKKVEVMLEQIERLDEIVREFELIKSKEGMTISQRDLNELVKEVVTSAQQEAARQGVDLEVTYESAPVFVNMDSDLIKFSVAQCLKLLLGRIRDCRRIFILLRREKFGAIVTLTPAGTAPSRKGILQGARRVHTSVVGRRLGLSTVRQILRDHGGELEVVGAGEQIKIKIFLPFSIGTGKGWGSDGGSDSTLRDEGVKRV
ncbi:MAG: HAMP domain-containing histidine kinase [Thermodesulfobacteria bacterium]|nr:HAMP domain-containing histidine kinase [Thermodesulfobacteriota bacterium]